MVKPENTHKMEFFLLLITVKHNYLKWVGKQFFKGRDTFLLADHSVCYNYSTLLL